MHNKIWLFVIFETLIMNELSRFKESCSKLEAKFVILFLRIKKGTLFIWFDQLYLISNFYSSGNLHDISINVETSPRPNMSNAQTELHVSPESILEHKPVQSKAMAHFSKHSNW